MSDLRISSSTALPAYRPAAGISPADGQGQSVKSVSDGFAPSGESTGEITAAVLAKLTEPSRVLDEPTRIYPDNYGRVKHLALQLSDYVYGSVRKDVLQAYQKLFTEMEPDTKFTVVVESDRDRRDVEKIIQSGGVPNPERIEFIKPENLDLTVWARDQMISMYFPEGDGSKTALTNQSMLHDWHNDDEQVPQYIAAKYPSIVLDPEKRLVTDGGEVVSNRGETFIGAFSVNATAKKLKALAKKDADFAQKIQDYAEQQMGMKVRLSQQENPFPFELVERETSPLLHEQQFLIAENPAYKAPQLKPGEVSEADMWVKVAVDLFEKEFGQKVTPMGMDVPETPEIEGPANDHLDMGLTPLDEKTMAVGDPSLALSVLGRMAPERREEVAALLSQASGIDVKAADLTMQSGYYPNQQRDFDSYAKQLEDSGYRVVRLPYAEPSWGRPNISFNNCLMERFHREDGTEVKRVFLPVYGIQELDELAVKTYESEGFEVHPMPLATLATRKGALRCMSQWLEREQHEAKF